MLHLTANVTKKVHSDLRMNPANFTKIPFDMKRFWTGEFTTIASARP